MSILKFFISLFIIIIFIKPANLAFASQIDAAPPNCQYSTWLWDTSQIVKSSDKIIDFLSSNNVKILFLQIDYDLNPDSYRSFIEKAFVKNIKVYALEGDPDWLSYNGVEKQEFFFNWLEKFQNSSSINEKFKGVNLDIEPYLNSDYNNNMNVVLENYQNSLTNALSNSNSLELPLSVDIPFWFDGVKYNNKYGSGELDDWIIKNIKNILVMVYRDNAFGENGIINLVSNELALGKQYNTVVTVAVETQKSSEGNYVSFYEEGINHMYEELYKVYSVYNCGSSFGGFAIHHVMSWINLNK